MPEVPRYQQRAGLARTPDVRISSQAPSDLFGRQAIEQTSQSIQRLGELGQKINAIEIQKADEISMVADDLALSQLENDLLHDRENGAFTLRGKDAGNAPKQVQDGWTKGVSRIQAESMTPRRREAFLRNVSYRQAAINRKVNIFVSGEIQRYDDETMDSYVVNMYREVVNSWFQIDLVVDKISKVEEALTIYGERNGKSKQWIDLNIAKFRSRSHIGVIGQMVENNQHSQADSYYAAFKDQVMPDQRERVGGIIEEGRLKTQSLAIVEDALANSYEILPSSERDPSIGPNIKTKPGASSYAELLERIQKDPRLKGDAKLLLATEKRARVRWDDLETGRKEDRKKRNEEIYRQIESPENRGRTPEDVIGPEVWSILEKKERDAFYAASEIASKGREPVTDKVLYNDIFAQATNNPKNFLRRDLTLEIPNLSTPDWKHFVKLQASMQGKDPKFSEKDLNGWLSVGALVDHSISNAGLDPSPKKGSKKEEKIDDLKYRIHQTVLLQESIQERPSTNQEIEEIANRLLSPEALKRINAAWGIFGDWFAADVEKLFFQFSPTELSEFLDGQNVQLSDIPAKEMPKIKSALERARIPVTRDSILSTYLVTRKENF